MELVKGGKVKRCSQGRPNRSHYLVGDKAYSSLKIRQQLRRSGTTPVIPKRSNQKRRGRFNRGLYRERNRVERLINRLKQYRRIATRNRIVCRQLSCHAYDCCYSSLVVSSQTRPTFQILER